MKVANEEHQILKFIRKCMRSSKIDLIVEVCRRSNSSMVNVEREFVSKVINNNMNQFYNPIRHCIIQEYNKLTKAMITAQCLKSDYPEYDINKECVVNIIKSIKSDRDLSTFIKSRKRNITSISVIRESVSLIDTVIDNNIKNKDKDHKKNKCQSCGNTILDEDLVMTQCSHTYHRDCLKSIVSTNIRKNFMNSKKQIELVELDEDEDSIDLALCDDENDNDDVYRNHRNEIKCKYCMKSIVNIKDGITKDIIWDIERNINLNEWDPNEEDYIIE